MKEIVWSEKAIEDYDRNLEYLLINWTEKEEIAFNLKVSKTLSNISEMPEMYPMAMIAGEMARRAVIIEQITLYYAVYPEYILLVRFWNNYQER